MDTNKENMDDETVEFEGFTFFKPSVFLPPIPPLRCCNGIHKGIDCNTEVVATYPQAQKIFRQQKEKESARKNPFQEYKETLARRKGGKPPQQSPLNLSLPSAFASMNTASPSPISTPRNSIPNNSTVTNNSNGRGSILQPITIPSIPHSNSNNSTRSVPLSHSNSTPAIPRHIPSTSTLVQKRNSLSFADSNSTGPSVKKAKIVEKAKITGNESLDDLDDFDAEIWRLGTSNSENKSNNSNHLNLSSNFAQQDILILGQTSVKTNTIQNLNQNPVNLVQQPITNSIIQQPSTSSISQTSANLCIKSTGTDGKFKSFLQDDTEKFSNDNLLPEDLRKRMYNALRNVFGFKSFRFCQKSVVIATLLNKNVCVLMPTGAGKSLCYQLTALVSDGLTLVISPLISLMMDQVQKMQALNIPAESLRGDTNKKTRDAIYADLNGEVKLKLLYVSPEMLSKSPALSGVLDRVRQKGKLSRIVVDEAHCISTWGHDFRMEYSQLPTYFRNLRGIPFMALTATATPQAIIDIRRSLKFDDEESAFFISSFVRSNISYDIMEKNATSFRKLIDTVKQKYANASGIVYCQLTTQCEEVADQLKACGLNALAYHGKMGNRAREIVQTRWMSGDAKIIVATIAFGMGIDKPDVRFVIHHSLSSSIEAYYQETGRAGRDGLPTHCTLLYSFADHTRYMKMFQEGSNNKEYQNHRVKSLYEMISYCENVTDCHRKLLVEHFGEIYDSGQCLKSQAPCYVCQISRQSGLNYKAYDFTEEAIHVLNSIIQMNKGKVTATFKTIIDLYRGIEKKSNKSNSSHSSLSLFQRGRGCNEDDVKRFVRKLLTEGYLSESLDMKSKLQFDLWLINVTQAGRKFIQDKGPKFFSFMAKSGKKNSSDSRLHMLNVVSEATVLKEKYKIKHFKVFRPASNELKGLMIRIAKEEYGDAGNPNNIISAEGVEQLAAMLPRTESEFLNIDSMTRDKYRRYGPRIFPVIQKYCRQIDQHEHNTIEQAVRKF